MNRKHVAPLRALALLVFLFWIAPAAAYAADAPQPLAGAGPVKIDPDTRNVNSGDVAWMLTSSALVLMMTGPGLALFYSGLVRRKNVLATMMQSFILMCIVTILWAIVGYSLAFDHHNPFIGGLRFAFMREVGANPSEYGPGIPHATWMVYQLMFAIITPGLICGAYAERMKFSAMMLFSALWLFCIYCPLAHMVWGKGGLLNWALPDSPNIAAFDFAGGTVVHISSGVSALICALVLGKRMGYGTTAMPPHSVVLSVIGACLLWVGWFGFNAGSAVAANALILDIIHRYKYNRALWFEPFLAGLLVAIASPALAAEKWDLLVPVPLYPVKKREREFNQAARLAARLGRAAKIPVNERLLRRVKPTTTQTRLTRQQRADNVRQAFAFCGNEDLHGQKIVLLDDVLTTGATTNACARALRQAGAGDICVWTVARAGLTGGALAV